MKKLGEDKIVSLIKSIIETSILKDKKILKKFDVSSSGIENSYTVHFYFNTKSQNIDQKDLLMNDVWERIYDLTGIPVFMVDETKSNIREQEEDKTNFDKKIKLLETFLSDYEVEGVCSFFLDPEEDTNGNIWVYIVIDLNWLKNIQTKPEFVAKRFREGLKDEIKNWLGIDVQVGSMAKRCD